MGLRTAIIRATIGPEGTYSAAEEEALNMTQPKMAGKDIAGYLKGRGVKEEEIRELGLDELMSQKSVTREELLDKIRENKVTFEERIYTGGGPEQDVTYTENDASIFEAYDPEILEGEIEFIREHGPLKDSIASDPDPEGFMGDITPEMREWAEGTREFENLDSIDQSHINTIARNMVEQNYIAQPSTILRLQADGQEVNGISLIRENTEDANESFVPAPDADIDLRRAMGFLRPDEIERDQELGIPINPPNFSLTSPEEAGVFLRNFGTENGYLNLGVGDARWAGNGFNLPGGSNYREIRLSLPGAMKFQESVHFPDDQNNVFHVRLKDRVDNEGRNVLFVEEAQSDWAQTIRKPDILTERETIYEGYPESDIGKPRGLQETMEQNPELIEQGKKKIQDFFEIPGLQEELDAFWEKVRSKEAEFTIVPTIDIPSWAIDLFDASNPSVDVLKKPQLLAKFLRDYYRQENDLIGIQLRDLILENTPLEKKLEIAKREVNLANERSNAITPIYRYPSPETPEGREEIDILFREYVRKRQRQHRQGLEYRNEIPSVAEEFNELIFNDGTPFRRFDRAGASNKLMRRARVNAGNMMREDLKKMGLHPSFVNVVHESIDAIEPGYVEKIRFEASKPQTAPFIRDTQAWNKLMIKRLVRLAEEEGYDGIAFSTGDVQYNRWPRTQDGRDNIGIKQQYDVNIPKAIRQVTRVKPSQTTITIPREGGYGGFEHTGPFIDLNQKTPDGETISEQARRGYTTFSMAGPAAALGVAALAQPQIAEASEMPISQGIGQLPSQRTGGQTEEFDYGAQEPSMLDKAIGAGEVAAEGIMDLLIEPLAGYIGTETAFDMNRSGMAQMSPEQMAAAGDRVRQAIDFEAKTPLGRQYKETVKAGLGSLGEYLMEPPGQFQETRDPLQILFQEAIDPAAVAVEEGILNLLSLDPRDTEEEEAVRREAARPVVQAIQPI